MKRWSYVMLLMAIILMLCGCKDRNAPLVNLPNDTDCKIWIREDRHDEYDLVTNEVIRYNLIQLVKENVSYEKIRLTKEGYVPIQGEVEIKFEDLEGEDYTVSFSIYYEREGVNGGSHVLTVMNDDHMDYYRVRGDLYQFAEVALTNNNIFTAEVRAIREHRLSLWSDVFCEYVYCKEIPENLELCSVVEITLGKIEDMEQGLIAEKIIVK